MSRLPSATARGLLALGIATAGLFAPGVAHASPPTTGCPTQEQPAAGDIDGDGTPDAAIGVPSAGAVDIRYVGRGSLLLRDSDLPAPYTTNLGAAVDTSDVDGDGCADLAIGAPGHGGAHPLPGEVRLVLGPPGIETVQSVTIVPADSAPGDLFGAAVAFGVHDLGGTSVHDLWVGAPGHRIDGLADAGVIYHYVFDAAGAPRLLEEFSELSTLVPGTARAGDRFGGVLAHVADGVLVGMPGKAEYGRAAAGQLDRIVIDDSSGRLVQSQALSLGTRGVAGRVVAGARFGASLAGGESPEVVVGVPGASVGTVARAGAVALFRPASGTSTTLRPAGWVTEDSAGVPGVARRGDRFGAAVVVGGITCADQPQYAVGVPGHTVGGRPAAGLVDVLQLGGGTPSCPSEALWAGHALLGSPRAHAGLGAHLGVIDGPASLDEDAVSTLLVGVPAATVDGQAGAGTVDVRVRTMISTFAESGGAVAHAGYGAVFAPD